MNDSSYQPTGSHPLMLVTALLVLAGTVATTAFSPFKALNRARLAEAIANGRQVKLCLDSFAMDHDGVYPGAETAKIHNLSTEGNTSNEYFRQLFAAKILNSEKIFWTQGARVCNAEAPDDIISDDGEFRPDACLQAGDCGWAYFRDQKNINNPGRPILLDAFLPGTKTFDDKIHEGKVVIVRIDGSANAIKLDPKGRVIDQDEDILSPKAAIWKGSETSPAKLLAQPLPSKAAQQKVEATKKAGENDPAEKEE